MRQPPYNEARRVFWIMDNGSAHRGVKCVARLQEKFPRLVAVHGSVHASWLNQIEIYFSIVQRKVLTPTTSLRWPPSRSDCWRSRTTTRLSPNRSSSLVAILPPCSTSSARRQISRSVSLHDPQTNTCANL